MNHQAPQGNDLSRINLAGRSAPTYFMETDSSQIPKPMVSPLSTQSPPQAHPRQQAGEALTSRGEEGYLPQEEGCVQVAQGLLHILQAGAARPGQENKRKTYLTTEKAEEAPAPLITERPGYKTRVMGDSPGGKLCPFVALNFF